jgi:hypothetical protein
MSAIRNDYFRESRTDGHRKIHREKELGLTLFLCLVCCSSDGADFASTFR